MLKSTRKTYQNTILSSCYQRNISLPSDDINIIDDPITIANTFTLFKKIYTVEY